MFTKGILIGLISSIPLGPAGVLCIQRTLSKNRASGFVSGLGASSADLLFAAVALFSLAFVMGFIEHHLNIIKVIGGICVVAVGVSIFMKNPVVQIRRNRAGQDSYWSDFLSVFFVTLANPAFILIYVALFAAFGISTSDTSMADALTMILGVFSGATGWWFLLSFVINIFRHKFRPRHLLWINRIAGVVIVVLGAAAILTIFINTPVGNVIPG